MIEIYKITTYVVPEDIQKLKDSIFAISPLTFGKYEKVFWSSSKGEESYLPLSGSNPTVGTIGKEEKVSSCSLTFLMPRDNELLEKIISLGIRPAHSWEEPVIIIEKCFTVTSNNIIN